MSSAIFWECTPSAVTSVAFSLDGRFCFSGSKDKMLKVWEIERGGWNQQYRYSLARVWSHDAYQKIQSENTLLPQGPQQQLSRMRHMLLREARQRLGPQTTATYLPTWEPLYSVFPKTRLQAAWLMRTLTGHTSVVTSVAFSPDGHYLLSGSKDQTLKVWEVESGDCLRTLTGHTLNVNSVAFSADGRYLLSGSNDQTLKVWEVESGRCLRTLRGHRSVVTSVAFSADGRYLLSGSSDQTLKMWEVESGRCLRTLTGHTESVNSVAFSPDGRYALSGSRDKTLKVWEVESGRCLRSLTGHTDLVYSVAFSPDGRLALSSSGSIVHGSDYTLKVWEVESGRCLRTLRGHTESVNSVAFSPDGHYLLSGSWDNTLKVWEVESGRCLRTLTGHTFNVISVAFSPDARYALSGSYDGTIKMWALDWELEARELANWNEGARPYLENFLTRQTPFTGSLPQDREPTEEEIQLALTRQGKPTWTEEAFQQLIRELQGAGYGWLRPEGVNVRLLRMTRRR